MTRSHAPVFWLLFGAGGMLAALFGPALVYVTGWMNPLTFANASAVAHSLVGKLFLFFAVALFAWHAAHRILCSLHDVGIHKGLGAKLCCYGAAGIISITAAVALAGV